MRRHTGIGLFGAGAVLVTALVWPLLAAPIMPQREVLPAEVLSLAGIDRVQLHLLDLPPVLERGGLTKRRVRDICAHQLALNAVEVEDDETLPRLEIWFKEVEDRGHFEMRSVITIISMYQPVDVARLDRRMTVPTACFVGGTMTNKNDLVKALMRDLTKRSANLARAIEQASSRDDS